MRSQGASNTSSFRSVDEPDKVVLLERWATAELLEQHMAAERTRDSSAIDALVALWAPGTTPSIERFDA